MCLGMNVIPIFSGYAGIVRYFDYFFLYFSQFFSERRIDCDYNIGLPILNISMIFSNFLILHYDMDKYVKLII